MKFLGEMAPRAAGMEANVISDERILTRGSGRLRNDLNLVTNDNQAFYMYRLFSLSRHRLPS